MILNRKPIKVLIANRQIKVRDSKYMVVVGYVIQCMRKPKWARSGHTKPKCRNTIFEVGLHQNNPREIAISCPFFFPFVRVITKTLGTDFDQILWSYRLWRSDQLLRF